MQMIAERSRRSEFIQAEGNKAAMRLKSEGLKESWLRSTGLGYMFDMLTPFFGEDS
jgi:hypothetical protein